MNSKKNMKNVTVGEFLAAIKGKKYTSKSSDMPELVGVIAGDDIPKSLRMDTIERIYSYNNTFVLDYGERIPRYMFTEITSE